jgi:hypothetical protein
VQNFRDAVTGVKTGDLVNALKQGEYAIYFRGYKANEGIIRAISRPALSHTTRAVTPSRVLSCSINGVIFVTISYRRSG